jgi:ADP-heptose:LPS heptosyltransferase
VAISSALVIDTLLLTPSSGKFFIHIKMENLLVYRLGSLGDTIIALPSLHRIRSSFPDAQLVMLTNKPISGKAAPLQSILGTGYFTHQTLCYPVGTRNPWDLISLLFSIRRLRIKTMVYLVAARSPKDVWRDRVFFRLCGVRKIIGLPQEESDFKARIQPETGLYENESSRLARRVRDLGAVDLEDRAVWDLHLEESEHAVAEEVIKPLKGDPFLAVSQGTKMQAKDWGVDNWSDLLQQLTEALPGWGLLLVGSSDEAGRASSCAEVWRGPIVNLCGNATPRISAAAMERAAFFLGHDSGPMHLASAVGVPCIAIFSARNLPGQWYPYGRDHKVIYHKTSCHGCNLSECYIENKRCIFGITTDEVMGKVMELLEILSSRGTLEDSHPA